MFCNVNNVPDGEVKDIRFANVRAPNVLRVTHSTDMDKVSGKRLAFSATSRQIIRGGDDQEGLHLQDDDGKAVDRRAYIDYQLDTSRAASNFGVQIEGRLPDGTAFTGSGTRCCRNGRLFILTCAHNVVSVTPEGFFQPYTDITGYEKRIGDDAYVWKLRVTEIVVHPKHNNNPKSGFNIAVLFFDDLPGKNYTTEYYSAKPEIRNSGFMSVGENLRATMKGKTVAVVGYPAEKVPPAFQSSWVSSLLGYGATPGRWAYGHSGPIAEVEETEGGGYVMSYKVDTTPGNSGSAISIHREETVNVYGKNFPKVKVIGVHTGSNQGLGTNYGTLITRELMKWIHHEVDKRAQVKKNN